MASVRHNRVDIRVDDRGPLRLMGIASQQPSYLGEDCRSDCRRASLGPRRGYGLVMGSAHYRSESNDALHARMDELEPEAIAYGEVEAAKRERRRDALRAASLQLFINAVGTVLAAGVLYSVAQLSGLLAGVDWVSIGYLAAMALPIGYVVIVMGREARLPRTSETFVPFDWNCTIARSRERSV